MKWTIHHHGKKKTKTKRQTTAIQNSVPLFFFFWFLMCMYWFCVIDGYSLSFVLSFKLTEYVTRVVWKLYKVPTCLRCMLFNILSYGECILEITSYVCHIILLIVGQFVDLNLNTTHIHAPLKKHFLCIFSIIYESAVCILLNNNEKCIWETDALFKDVFIHFLFYSTL